MGTTPSWGKHMLITGTAGVAVGLLLASGAKLSGLPLVFQLMAFTCPVLAAAVFILLDAPPLNPMGGPRAAIALAVFYGAVSGLYVGWVSVWPQGDPEEEAERIGRILETRSEHMREERIRADELLQRAEKLERKVKVLMARLNQTAPGLTRVPSGAADGATPPSEMTLVERGQEVYDFYECYNCHKIGGKGALKKKGPNLDNIGNLLTVSDIKKKIIDPGYLYAEGFEKEHKKGQMPEDYRDLMLDEELDALGAYLSTLKNPGVETPRPVFVKATVQHGFTIYGYVYGSTGTPVSGIEVTATPLKDHGHGAKARTNDAGYFEIFLHMHNEDAGTEIRVTAGEAQAVVVADYDPSDKVTKRQTSIDLRVQS